VRSIRVQSPEITFEGGLKGNNLGKIMDNLNATTKAAAQAPSTQSAKAKPARKFEVDDFVVTGAKVHASLTGLGGREMTLTLPDIHLTNLGKGDNGVTATDLSRRVLQAVVSATIRAVANSSVDIGKNVENLGKQGGHAVSNSVNKISHGLGDLFKK
jgi:hypothetical protein